MKTVIYIVAGFLMSALVVACGSSNDGTVAAANPNALVGANCPVGTYFQYGSCVGVDGRVVQAGVGFYSETGATRNMSVNGHYAEFLRDAMGICDREKYSGGGASCSTWMNGAFDVVIQSPTATAQTTILQATFRAVRRNTGAHSDYSYSLPSAGAMAGAMLGFPVPSSPAAYLPKLQLNMTVSVTNNYQGFEARGYGDFNSKANRSLIQIQIPQGKLEDSSFPYRIAYRGKIIANGQFVRCNTADCGLSQPLRY